jgi:hypothetical protein
MFDKAGYFHFGKNHSEPIGALRSELVKTNGGKPSSDSGDLKDSLIVLPEAFNIRKRYKEDGNQPSDNNPAIIGDLQRLADEFGIAFVAGLIVDRQDGIHPPYSSGYFVDGSGHALMCHKISQDGFEGKNYTPYPEWEHSDPHNPLVLEEDQSLVIGALICVDATPGTRNLTERTRLERLMSRMDECDVTCRIVAVPACISNNFWGGAPGNRLTLPCNNNVVVMANSDPYGQVKSFITNERAEILDCSVGGEENRIVVRRLRNSEQST